MNPDALTRWALANPEEALWQLAKPRAEQKLIDFVELTWSVLEPSRPFVRGRAVEAICEHLEAVHRGEIQNLLICVPPGLAKSLLTNVFFPAWEMGPRNSAHLRYFTASYAEHLTIRDNRRTMKLIDSRVYKFLWGDRVQIDPDQRAKTQFATLQTGWKLASSVGGTATGERGDRIIIDDCLSAADAESDAKIAELMQWWTEVLPSRVNDVNTTAMIVIGQRLTERDVPGFILEHEKENWSRLILPMEYEPDHPYPCETEIGFKDWRTEEGELLQPERIPRTYLEEVLKPKQRAWGGEYAIASQLQQRPAPRGGGMFRRETIGLIDRTALPELGDMVRGWDLAASKDGRAAFTVGALLQRATIDGRQAYVIRDIIRGRFSPGDLRTRILATATSDGRRVTQDLPQDPGQAGLSQKHDLGRLLDGFDVRITPESGSKEDRARPLAAQAELGNVFMVRAPWNETLLREMETFPAGAYKDQVDALSRAYARLLRSRTSSVGGAPQVVFAEGEE